MSKLGKVNFSAISVPLPGNSKDSLESWREEISTWSAKSSDLTSKTATNSDCWNSTEYTWEIVYVCVRAHLYV